jgi:hypothetical protein
MPNNNEAREAAAAQVQADREAAVSAGYPAVGLAEYVDLLTALHELTQGVRGKQQRTMKQLEWLRRVAVYALVKHAGQRQAPLTKSDEAE